MKVSKIIKWVILTPIILFFVIWIGSLAKNRILTELHRDEIEKLYIANRERLPDYDWFRVLLYSENEIKIYFVEEVNSKRGSGKLGGIVTFSYGSDGAWHHNWCDNYLWSTSGSADNYIWPYWYHGLRFHK